MGLEKYHRINLINQLSGVKGANLLGTISQDGISNLAIFNSVCHIGANPASMGFLLRPLTVERHTYDNIMASKQFTINQVRKEFLEEAHLSSAKFPKDVSEFQALGLEEEFIEDYSAPFVKESHIKIALTYEEQHEIKLNKTVFIVGKIDYVIIEDRLIEEMGHINYSVTDSVSVAGLDTYYSTSKIDRKAYARVPK